MGRSQVTVTRHDDEATFTRISERDAPWPAVAETAATTSTRGVNRRANALPNWPASIDASFTSMAGPTTMNTSLAVSENALRLAAMKASASELAMTWVTWFPGRPLLVVPVDLPRAR